MEGKYKKAGDLLEGLGLPRPRLAEAVDEKPAEGIKTVGEFIGLVERMREAQRNFFESHGNRVYLQKARELEGQVDACIAARKARLSRENPPAPAREA
jgi:hypothetical protein